MQAVPGIKADAQEGAWLPLKRIASEGLQLVGVEGGSLHMNCRGEQTVSN